MRDDEEELEARRDDKRRGLSTRKPSKRKPRTNFEPESDDAWMIGTDEE